MKDVESLGHLLAGLAAGPVLLVARTLSYLFGIHETSSALKLEAWMVAAGEIIVAGLVKYFASELSGRHPRTCRMSNAPKLWGSCAARRNRSLDHSTMRPNGDKGDQDQNITHVNYDRALTGLMTL